MLTLLFVPGAVAFAQAAKREFHEIKIYTISNPAQEQGSDACLKDAYIPAMHRQGIKTKVNVRRCWQKSVRFYALEVAKPRIGYHEKTGWGRGVSKCR
jgi:predicted secreted acid phosphatase